MDTGARLKVEEVFKTSGVPTHTFVEPSQYNTLKVALRTPGRGVVIEGPSGIGKSTAVNRLLQELGADSAAVLSARREADIEYIDALPNLDRFGLVIVDDFHRLDTATKQRLADLLKLLADNEDASRKLVIIGINEAGYSLIQFAPDLANRIDRIRFEVEPSYKISELISLGETALNAEMGAREQIVDAALGSFYIAQMLCQELCIESGVLASAEVRVKADASYSTVKRRVMEKQDARFGEAVHDFVRGPRFRPGGRAPYLHILRWLTDSASWSINLRDEMASHPTERISVGQVVEKGYLAAHVSKPEIASILHFDATTQILSVEDPHLVFYLKNLDWPEFIRRAGFTKVDFEEEYDLALSFAGEDRLYSERLYDHLSDLAYAVFYDQAEQHRILASNVEEYLGPIYASRARFVIAVLGPRYGEKRWTIFESKHFKPRIEKGEVIVIWSKKVPASAFDATREVGYITYDPDGDLDRQARDHAAIIDRKLGEGMASATMAGDG
jgi:hypothetical protein